MDLAWWANKTGLWAAVATAIAALLGVVSWVLSGWVADEKEAALREFQETSRRELSEERNRRDAMELALEKQREATAGAQREVEELKRRNEPRILNRQAFQMALLGGGAGTAEVWYEDDNQGDAYGLAIQFWATFKNSGWTTSLTGPAIIDPNSSDIAKLRFDENLRMPTTTLWIGGTRPLGVALAMPDIEEKSGPAVAIKNAMLAGGLGAGLVRDDRLSPKTFKILIGRKR